LKAAVFFVLQREMVPLPLARSSWGGMRHRLNQDAEHWSIRG
jgi:hypothetical protein